jgi:P-type Cu+ transporter
VPTVEIGGTAETVHHTHRKESSMFGKKKSPAKVVDPVCGMKIDPARAAATREDEGTTIYFCSTGCAQTFDADPHRYGQAHAGHEH